MFELLVGFVVPVTVVILIIIFFALRSRAKQAELKLKLEVEADNAVIVLNSCWGNFIKEFDELGKQLRLEKDLQFIKKLRAAAYTILESLSRQVESITHCRPYDKARELIGEIISKNEKPCLHIWAEVYKRLAEYEKALREAPSWIQVARQHLETYEEELSAYIKDGYQLGPDRYFAASEALIREAEKLMACSAPDPEKAIAKCKESTDLAADFVGRMNRWIIAHGEAKELLERARGLEHHLRERYKPACNELDLLQREYPTEIWYPLDIAFGGNQILDQLKELTLKRFKAMDKMDMKIQDFEGAVVMLRDILEELKRLEEVIEKPIKTRAELCAEFAQKIHEV